MEQSIKIKIAGYTFPLKVNSQEQEEYIRKSAQEINRQITAFQTRYPNKSLIEILSIMSLNVCVTNMTLSKQMKDFKDAEESLAKELNGYLDNIDKNSR
jgi:cell division protein ZapA (FtsZ GTPase activity inhibitor)